MASKKTLTAAVQQLHAAGYSDSALLLALFNELPNEVVLDAINEFMLSEEL